MDDSIRTGEQRTPPGQYVTKKWPVLTYGETQHVATEDFKLRIFGGVEEEVELDWTALQALERIELTADFHCVTRFSTFDNPWAGISTRTLLSLARVHPDMTHVMAHCYGGYTTNMPLEDFLSERSLLADQHGGQPIDADHGGPLRLIVPHLYAWKSAKWLNGIELLAQDERGFWEQNGYHTYGDPWTEQRFSSQEIKHAHEVRRRAAELGITPEAPQGSDSGERTKGLKTP